MFRPLETRRPQFKSRAARRSARFAWFVVAGGLLSALALVGYGLWRGGFGGDIHGEWRRLSGSLRAAGEPLDLADVTPAAVPDEQNVFSAGIFAGLATDAPRAPLLQRAVNPGGNLTVGQLLAATPDGRGAHLEQVAAAMQAAGVLREQADFLLVGDRVRAGLRALGLDFAPLAAVASARPGARFPLAFDRPFPPLPHLRYLEALGQWLAIDAIAALSSGDDDHAARDLLLISRLADSVAGEPFLASLRTRRFLLGLAAGCVGEGLGADTWTNEDLGRFTTAFGRPRLFEDLARSLRGERAHLNAAVDEALAGKTPAPPAGLATWLGGDVGDLDALGLRKRQVATNLSMQRAIEESLTWPTVPPPPAHPDRPPDATIAMLNAEIRLTRQIQTSLAQITAACALERFRRLRDTYPERLDELVPALIEALPAHPPLSYRRVAADRYELSGGPDDARWTWTPKNRPAAP